jgi:cell division septal protein FtsQ
LKQLFAVKQTSVQSTTRQSEITREAQAIVASNWAESNLLTLSGNRLSTQLLAVDPMIKTATVSKYWPNRISVKITLKQPSLGWTSGNQSFLLDRDGTVIGAFPTGQALPVVQDNSNLPVQLGQRVVSSQFVGFTTDVAAAMARLKLGPAKLEVKDTTADLYATTTAGYQLIFDTSRSSVDEIADLQTILTALAAQKKQASQYIDLRVVGRAYYK